MNVQNAAKNTKNVFLCLISNFVFILLSRHELTSFDCLSLLQLYLTHLSDFFFEEAAYVDCWYVFILQLIPCSYYTIFQVLNLKVLGL
jgi:hypothetical protein